MLDCGNPPHVGDQQGPPGMVETVSQRFVLLTALADGERQVRDLVDDLDSSRSTVNRGLRDLEAADLIERGDEGYRPTLAGRMALSLTEDYYDEMRDVDAMSEALTLLPPDAPLPSEAVTGGEAFLGTAPDPYRPDEVVLEAFASADHCRHVYGLLSDRRLLDASHERLLAGELTSEAITTPEMIAHLREEHPEKHAEGVASGRIDFYVARDVPPFGLLLPEHGGETTLLVGIGRPSAGLEALIRNDAPEAVAWGEAFYEEIRDRAMPLEEFDDASGADAP